MELIGAYFDESGTHDTSPFACMAGYVIRSEKAIELHEAWAEMLKRHGLAYFHMTDCAVDPGFGEFAGRHGSERDVIAREAIDLIKQHIEYGIGVSVDRQHEHLIPRNTYKSVYTFLCWQALIGVRLWARRAHYHGEVIYFFEDGHDSKTEAIAVMSRVLADTRLRSAYRYSGALTFADKRKVLPLQCADVLAWHWYTNQRRIRDGHRVFRKDFENLLSVRRHWLVHYDQSKIKEMIATHQSIEQTLTQFQIKISEAEWARWCIQDSYWGNITYAVRTFSK